MRAYTDRALDPSLTLQGYALVEYEKKEQAEAAIDGASGTPLLEQVISCDFAFVRPPVG